MTRAKFRVIDSETNQGIRQAEVLIQELMVVERTYQYGIANFDNVPIRQVTAVITCDGYSLRKEEINFTDNTLDNTFTIILTKKDKVIVFGQVIGDGKKIPNADIILKIASFKETTKTDNQGDFYFDISKDRIITIVNLTIDHPDYKVKDTSFYIYLNESYKELPNVHLEYKKIIDEKNNGDTTFDTLRIVRSKIKLVNWREYSANRNSVIVGVFGGFGYRARQQAILSNIPSNIRTGHPHPEDLRNRPNEILDSNISDSYLIEANRIDIDLPERISLDLVNISLKGLISISIRTSPIRKEPEKIEFRNYHRKKYTMSGGDAFIYYSINPKKSPFNLSIPIYGTLPIFCFGKDYENVFRVVAGTNILRPTIKLEAEKGWDRFGQLDPYEIVDVGELKETEWFGGFDIERPNVQFGFQVALAHATLNTPLPFNYQDKFWPSYWFKFAYLFNNLK